MNIIWTALSIDDEDDALGQYDTNDSNCHLFDDSVINCMLSVMTRREGWQRIVLAPTLNSCAALFIGLEITLLIPTPHIENRCCEDKIGLVSSSYLPENFIGTSSPVDLRIVDFRTFDHFVQHLRATGRTTAATGLNTHLPAASRSSQPPCPAFSFPSGGMTRLLYSHMRTPQALRLGPPEIFLDVHPWEILTALLTTHTSAIPPLTSPLPVILPPALGWVARHAVMAACQVSHIPVKSIYTTTAALAAAFSSTEQCQKLLLSSGAVRVLVVEIGLHYISASVVSIERVLSTLSHPNISHNAAHVHTPDTAQSGDTTNDSSSPLTPAQTQCQISQSKKRRQRKKKKSDAGTARSVSLSPPISHTSPSPSSSPHPASSIPAMHFSCASSCTTVRVESNSSTAQVGLAEWEPSVISDKLQNDWRESGESPGFGAVRDAVHYALANNAFLVEGQTTSSSLGGKSIGMDGILLWLDQPLDGADSRIVQSFENHGQNSPDSHVGIERAVRAIVEEEIRTRFPQSDHIFSGMEGTGSENLSARVKFAPASIVPNRWMRMPKHAIEAGTLLIHGEPHSAAMAMGDTGTAEDGIYRADHSFRPTSLTPYVQVFEAPCRTLGLRVLSQGDDAWLSDILWLNARRMDMALRIVLTYNANSALAMDVFLLSTGRMKLDTVDTGMAGAVAGVKCGGIALKGHRSDALVLEVVEGGCAGGLDDSVGTVLALKLTPLCTESGQVVASWEVCLGFTAKGGALGIKASGTGLAAGVSKGKEQTPVSRSYEPAGISLARWLYGLVIAVCVGIVAAEMHRFGEYRYREYRYGDHGSLEQISSRKACAAGAASSKESILPGPLGAITSAKRGMVRLMSKVLKRGLDSKADDCR